MQQILQTIIKVSKKTCIDIFNSKSEYKRKTFIDICLNIYNCKVWTFKYSESKIESIIYERKNKSNNFTKYFFMENTKTRKNLNYLRNYTDFIKFQYLNIFKILLVIQLDIKIIYLYLNSLINILYN